jgi:SAM-dependent methyltransferase
VTNTYGDVDRSADPEKAVEWQDRVDSWPQIQAYKRRIGDLFSDDDTIADIGCGPGGSVLAIGADRCVGVDRSRTMCVEARARGARAILGDACHLPFADRALGGAFADRVVQHVTDPEGAVAEMVRVLRPGGRFALVDPDQESLSIHVPGVEGSVIERVKRLRRDIGYRNGRFVSSVPALIATLGLTDVSVEPFPLVLTDPAEAFGLPSWPRIWRSEGGFTDREIAQWEERVDVSGNNGFLFSVTYLVISGTRP